MTQIKSLVFPDWSQVCRLRNHLSLIRTKILSSHACSCLLEILRHIFEKIVSTQLCVCLEFSKVNQLVQRDIWLVFLRLHYLPLHLDFVAIVCVELGIVLFISHFGLLVDSKALLSDLGRYLSLLQCLVNLL